MITKALSILTGLSLGLFVSISIDGSEATDKAVLLSPSKAFAQARPVAATRGTARRTARRTTRRVVRRNTLPAGCVRRGAYYYCGGVYYQPVVEGGATVYIVVNP